MPRINATNPLFLLEHVYEDAHGEHVKTIGLFSSRELAEREILKRKDKPGFVRFQDGFVVSEIYVDVASWEDGFGFE
jgi:hypothetical protein